MTPYRFGTVHDSFEHRFGKIQNGPKRCQNGVQNENDLESLPMESAGTGRSLRPAGGLSPGVTVTVPAGQSRSP